MQLDYQLDALVNSIPGWAGLTVIGSPSTRTVDVSTLSDCPACDDRHGVSVELDTAQVRELRDLLDAVLGEKRFTAPF